MNEDKDKPQDLKSRTKQYAVKIIRLYAALPKTTVAQMLGKQLLRSGTSVGAHHYREACRGKSSADFISKIEGTLQELEETQYWLELLGEAGQVPSPRWKALVSETDELLAIFVTVVRRTKDNDNTRR